MRAFFCIPIGERLRTDIAGVSHRLREGSRMSASWVRSENYHVTVRFLGEIDPMMTTELHAICRGVSSHVDPFALPVDRIGAFPSLDRPRVLWAGGDAPEIFVQMTDALNQRLSEQGFPLERKPRVSHITVARVKGRPDPGLAGLLGTMNPLGFAPAHVDRIVLMQSELSRNGARYSPLFTVPLGGSGRPDEGA